MKINQRAVDEDGDQDDSDPFEKEELNIGHQPRNVQTQIIKIESSRTWITCTPSCHRTVDIAFSSQLATKPVSVPSKVADIDDDTGWNGFHAFR